jgi:hypothetical protein
MGAIRVLRRLAEMIDTIVSGPADGDVLAFSASTGKWANAHRLQRSASYVFAASDSPVLAKACADETLPASGAQARINAVIAAMGSLGGVILFLVGSYNTAATVSAAHSWVKLVGESRPMWGSFQAANGYYGGAGAVGTACAKIQASAGGFPLITIPAVSGPVGADNRHRGVEIANLYIVGNAYDNKGIEVGGFGSETDCVVIRDNFFHLCQTAISGVVDAVRVVDNDIQDCYHGINLFSWYGTIDGNLVADCDGTGIWVHSRGAANQINFNRVVRVRGDGIVSVQQNSLTGNIVDEACGVCLWIQPDGNPNCCTSVTGGTISIGTATTESLDGVGLRVGTGAADVAKGCSIGGVTFLGHGAVTRHAIDLRFAEQCTLTGCPVLNWSVGGYSILPGYNNTRTGNGGAELVVTIAGAVMATATKPPLFHYDATQIPGAADGAALPAGTFPSLQGGANATAAGTAIPTYRSAGINGHPAVEFDGTTDGMDLSLSGTKARLQLFAVVQRTAATASVGTFVSNANGPFVGFDAANEVAVWTGNATPVQPVQAVASTSPHVYEALCNHGATPDGRIGVDGVNVDANTSTLAYASLKLGYSANGERLNGKVGEIVGAEEIYSDADRARARAALGVKWGIATS